MNDGIGNAIGGLVTLLFICVPLAILGIWKLIEIVIFLFSHIRIV